jgi:indole-3-glycerol phosphate synthase/phosphoribosylanthranilate isomerase
VADFLSDLVPEIAAEVERRRAEVPEADLLARIAALPPPQDVLGALGARPRPFVVAEFKRASPSAGPIAARADVEATVRAYERGGAAMVSVLTEGRHFGGSLEDLRRARRATRLPLLRKDFVIDPYQLAEARAAGADAVLLIAALLPGARLAQFVARAQALGLVPLVEAHDGPELERALLSGARLVGVNNRDLRRLRTDRRVAEGLLWRVPAGVVALAESGMAAPQHVRRAYLAGADGVLVGERLMAGGQPEAAIRRLAAAVGPWVKICGLRSAADAAAAAAAGADAVGFVFAPSPRRVTAPQVRAWAADLPPEVERVGVFASAPVAEVLAVAEEAHLSGVQLHGAEPAADVAPLRERGLLVLKGFAASGGGPTAAEAAPYLAHGAAALLDGRLGPRPDGRGAAGPAAPPPGFPGRRFLLAGGLTPENVAQRVRQTGAAGADVSGGVEGAAGKDAARMRQFVLRAREG